MATETVYKNNYDATSPWLGHEANIFIFVYKYDPRSEEGRGLKYEDNLVMCVPWPTELPSIGHQLAFTYKDKFYTAKIYNIEWLCGNALNPQEWLVNNSVHIYAETIKY